MSISNNVLHDNMQACSSKKWRGIFLPKTSVPGFSRIYLHVTIRMLWKVTLHMFHSCTNLSQLYDVRDITLEKSLCFERLISNWSYSYLKIYEAVDTILATKFPSRPPEIYILHLIFPFHSFSSPLSFISFANTFNVVHFPFSLFWRTLPPRPTILVPT